MMKGMSATKSQQKFLDSSAQFKLAVGEHGSGRTWVMCEQVAQLLARPMETGIVFARNQHAVGWLVDELLVACKRNGLDCAYSHSQRRVTVPGTDEQFGKYSLAMVAHLEELVDGRIERFRGWRAGWIAIDGLDWCSTDGLAQLISWVRPKMVFGTTDGSAPEVAEAWERTSMDRFLDNPHLIESSAIQASG